METQIARFLLSTAQCFMYDNLNELTKKQPRIGYLGIIPVSILDVASGRFHKKDLIKEIL